MKELKKTISINTPVTRAFEAWADPKHIKSWFVDRAEGHAETDPTVTWYWESFGIKDEIQVETSKKPEKLTFVAKLPTGKLIVTSISFKEVGKEKCRLELTESGFSQADEDLRNGRDSGWTLALSLLKLYLENYFGSPRRNFTIIRNGPFSYRQMPDFFFNNEGLRKWLAREIQSEGDRKVLTLHSGTVLHLETLEKTAYDIAFRQDEFTLSLKAFACGSDGGFVLEGKAWEPLKLPFDDIERDLEKAADQLFQIIKESQTSSAKLFPTKRP